MALEDLSIQKDTIDLSMSDPDGFFYTANIYYVDGVIDATGANRPLTMGQLVMAICLARASDLELEIVRLMNEMCVQSEQLEGLTKIEEEVVSKN
ncbi:MAG: hypothetical protein J5614_06580, partial [Paludibacteraceae bacterium]|nr:hypothetical protein [Paludibacteraceae bacterium]